MRISTAIAAGLSALLLAGPARAGFPYNGLAPIPSDPATMALAKKAIGKACRFDQDKVGPQIGGFVNLPKVGQSLEWDDGFVFVRRHGPYRVAFLARDEEHRCRILDAQPLPPPARAEAFLQCRIESPDEFVNRPISSGLGLRQNGKRPLAAYLEADAKAGRLTPRDGDDKRIRCSEFESGD